MKNAQFLISVATSLDDLPEDVIQELEYKNQPEIFFCLDWLRCLKESVFRTERNVRIYIARDSRNKPVGVLPCSTIAGSPDLLGLTNYYSLDYRSQFIPDADTSAELQASIIYAIVDYISRERPRWRSVSFEYLRSDRDDARLLRSALRSCGFISIQTHQYDNWYLTTNGTSFPAYYEQRSSQLRNTITRKEKKILKSHTLQIRIINSNGAELDEAIQQYVAIYNSSWKKPEPYPQFIPAFARLCARLSILRLGIAYIDGVAAAAQFWIVSNHRAIIYKLAYDEKFSELSVGAILSRELFRHSIDTDKVEEIDYGIGSESYKRDWMSSVRTFDAVKAYNARSLGGIASLSRRVFSAISHRLIGKAHTK